MGGLLLPHRDLGVLDSRAVAVARKLTAGDPTSGWRGDPRLELRVGRVENRRTGKVRIDPATGRPMERYEVWRDCSDAPRLRKDPRHGSWQRIAVFEMTEVERIVPEMIRMDPRNRHHVDLDARIDAHEAQEQKKVDDELADVSGGVVEYTVALAKDLYWGVRHQHALGGLPNRVERRRQWKEANRLRKGTRTSR